MARVTGSSPVLPTTFGDKAVNILDWLKSRKSKIGEASGTRVNEAIANQKRLDFDLPPQRRAVFLDADGTKSYHDIDVQRSGEPTIEVKIKVFRKSKLPEGKVYHYESDSNGYMIYRQI